MKVFALASLAALSQAMSLKEVETDWDCYGEWIWEECSQLYYQESLCEGGWDTEGWWYSPEPDFDEADDFFVTADEFDLWEECWDEDKPWAADNWCDNDWTETGLGNYWRFPCEDEGATDCGWVYWGEEDDGSD